MHAGIAGRLGWIVMTLLAGCAAAPSAPPAPQTPPPALTTEVLAKLGAHHVHDLDALLGQPQKAKDGISYVWTATETVKTYVPNTTPSNYGFIGAPSPDSTDHATGADIEHDAACKLRVSTDASELVRNIDFNGPRKVCDDTARRLAQWITAAG